MMLEGEVEDQEIEAQKGDFINAGSARKIYRMLNHDGFVIKELPSEAVASDNSNRTEWQVWNQIRESKFAPLFGECKCISISGRYLIMERLEDLDEEADGNTVPAMPIWLTDRKRDNLGRASNGKIKVRDYGQVKECVDRGNSPTQEWPTKEASSPIKALLTKLDALA